MKSLFERLIRPAEDAPEDREWCSTLPRRPFGFGLPRLPKGDAPAVHRGSPPDLRAAEEDARR